MAPSMECRLPLTVFADEKNLGQFEQAIEWTIEEVKAAQKTRPNAADRTYERMATCLMHVSYRNGLAGLTSISLTNS
jgi:hypothetical protein